MSVALILLSLAALCLGIFGWLWLCAGFRRGGWRGALGIAALQLSGLCLVYGILRGQPMAGLYTATFPPLAVAELVSLAQFPGLLGELAWKVAPYAVVVLVGCLALRFLRVWAAGLAVLAAMIAVVGLGDQVSREAMCEAAARHGLTSFQRSGFAWSLSAGQETAGGVHGFANVAGRRLGWSYRAMDWFELPKDSVIVVPEMPVACAG